MFSETKEVLCIAKEIDKKYTPVIHFVEEEENVQIKHKVLPEELQNFDVGSYYDYEVNITPSTKKSALSPVVQTANKE